MRTACLLATMLLACAPDAVTRHEPTASPARETPATSQARVSTDILHELAPIPGGTAVIVYDVEGPAGIAGTLETLVADGGYRRDNWVITVPLPGGVQEIRGSRVRTPELRWHGDGDDVGRKQPAALAATAAAIAALDPVARARVLTELRTWRAELDRAREHDPGERVHIAGIECVRVRAGAGEVCTWEALGLPLRYVGPAFRVVAHHVEQGTTLGASAFEIPAAALVEPGPIAAPPQLAALAAGDRAEILRLLRPELEPLPDLLAGG